MFKSAELQGWSVVESTFPMFSHAELVWFYVHSLEFCENPEPVESLSSSLKCRITFSKFHILDILML